MRQLFLGAACLGFAPIFVKLVAIGPTPIGIYRCGLAAIFLFVAHRFEKRQGTAPVWTKALAFYVALAGGFFALDLFVWHRAVIYAGAGLGTILANTQVFYVAAAGILWFGEKLTGRYIASVLLGFLGTYLLARYRLAPPPGTDRYWEGVVLGLFTGVVYAGYVLSMRQVERLSRGVSPTLRLALMSGITAVLLVPPALVEGSLRLPTPMEWLWFVLLALIAQVAGWLLIARNLGHVPISRAGVILIAQPLVSTIVGAMVFGERLSALQILGAAIVFVALYLGATSGRKASTAG